MQVGANITTSESLVGRTLADKYKIEEVIREDDYGIICRATHLLMDTPVTVKLLSDALSVDPNIVDRFSLEAKTISRLSHPNILNVTDFGKDIDGSVFIVLEYVDGETLEQLIAREGGLDAERASRITRQIAAAVSSAHSAGIIHRSLKPEKVLIYDAGNGRESTKVLDIGSFSAAVADDDVTNLDIKDVAYLSPEQCAAGIEADERSDVYSLGIMFYEMLAGEVPFMADEVPDLMIKHGEVPPPPLAAFRDDLPEKIEPILLNALAKNPDSRFQTMSAFAEDLQDVFAEKEADEAIVIPEAKAVAATGNGWKTAFIALLAMLGLGAGMIYMTRVASTDPVTQLPTDAGAQPVQPLNPATGANESGNLMAIAPGTLVQGDPSLLGPDVGGDGGGDGFDPWANTPVPPRTGSTSPLPPLPNYGPGGEVYNIPNTGDGSIFMQDQDGTVILVPKVVPDEQKNAEDTKKPSTDGKTDKPANDGKTEKTPPTETKKPKTETKPPAKKPETKPEPKKTQTVDKKDSSKSAGLNETAN